MLFSESRGQEIKNITKIEHARLFLFTFFVTFFMASLAQKLIDTIVPGSFFEQDHLLNLTILEFCTKKMT